MVVMETDSTLLMAAKKMDKDALITIFDAYSAPLFRYAFRLCGDAVMADHIVGDVFGNRGQARARNVGWRIDYQIATPRLAARARRAAIYTAKRFSDHAPLTIEYTGRL
jgi:exonuclease III